METATSAPFSSKKPGRQSAGHSFSRGRARRLAMQGKCRLCQRHEHAHQSNKEALLGMRVKVLAQFVIGSREKNSHGFILAERHKLPVAASEGHGNSHKYKGCNRNAGGECLKTITCEASHSWMCATSCTCRGKSSGGASHSDPKTFVHREKHGRPPLL
jgi:hypothetical protein